MKKMIFTLAVAVMSITACKKSPNMPAVSGSSISAADLKDSKATIVASGQLKKADEGLEMDYDLEIKEVADNKYQAKLKVNGVKLNGNKLNGFKSAVFGVVLGLNTTKEDKTIPLTTVLDVVDVQKGVFTFPVFEYKGDLSYELVDVATTLTINGGDMVVKDNAQFTMFGSSFLTVPGSTITIDGGNFLIHDNSTLSVDGSSTVTNFAILLSPKEKKISLIDKATVFVLPSGATEEQKPEVVKVKLTDTKNGKYGNAAVTLAGDPAGTIKVVYMKLAPVSANDPKDPKAMINLPEIKLEATHLNKKRGIIRFEASKVWSDASGHFDLWDSKPVVEFGDGWARVTLPARS